MSNSTESNSESNSTNPIDVTKNLPPIQSAPDIKNILKNPYLISAELWKGPYPPPDALEHFEKISPGFAKHVIAMTESQMSHRHEQEKRQLDKAFFAINLGQIISGTVSIAAILAGVFISVFGHPIGITVSVAGLIPLMYQAIEKNFKDRKKSKGKEEKN